jgi:hypothetical protein
MSTSVRPYYDPICTALTLHVPIPAENQKNFERTRSIMSRRGGTFYLLYHCANKKKSREDMNYDPFFLKEHNVLSR